MRLKIGQNERFQPRGIFGSSNYMEENFSSEVARAVDVLPQVCGCTAINRNIRTVQDYKPKENVN